MSLALADRFLRYFEAEKMKKDPLLKELKIYETLNPDGSTTVSYEMNDEDADKDIERMRKHKEVIGATDATSASVVQPDGASEWNFAFTWQFLFPK